MLTLGDVCWQQEAPIDDNYNLLHDGRHDGFHNHVTRRNHEQVARSDESSHSKDDDADNEVDIDVAGTDLP